MFNLFKLKAHLFLDDRSSIMGINQRNIDYVFKLNPRNQREIADSKVKCKAFLEQYHLPTASSIGTVESHVFIEPMLQKLLGRGHFVLKPDHGFGGEGILLVGDATEDGWLSLAGKPISKNDLAQHMANILYGVYSTDNSMDTVLVEEKINIHDFFIPMAYKGIPDIRIITYKSFIVMAMLRLPTHSSDGKANLHAGGLGVGIDLATGLTTRALSRFGLVQNHPDNGNPLIGMKIPFWDLIIAKSIEAAKVFPLGYLGFDWVIDQNHGPLILEVNARPGLEIQNVNGKGLCERIQELDSYIESQK